MSYDRPPIEHVYLFDAVQLADAVDAFMETNGLNKLEWFSAREWESMGNQIPAAYHIVARPVLGHGFDIIDIVRTDPEVCFPQMPDGGSIFYALFEMCEDGGWWFSNHREVLCFYTLESAGNSGVRATRLALRRHSVLRRVCR